MRVLLTLVEDLLEVVGRPYDGIDHVVMDDVHETMLDPGKCDHPLAALEVVAQTPCYVAANLNLHSGLAEVDIAAVAQFNAVIRGGGGIHVLPHELPDAAIAALTINAASRLPINFFQGGSPKQATPFLRQDLLTARNRFTPNFRGWGLDENLKPKSPPYRGAHYRGSAARQNEVGLAARAAASCRAPVPAPPSCIAIAMRSMQPPPFTTVQERCTRPRGGTFYPDEIDIQETHTKHRKLDSQAALPHPTRDRAPDGLGPQAWPLRASRRDHDPGGLPPWPAGLGGVRPAMAADRALRGPPARSPRQERDSQRAPDPR